MNEDLEDIINASWKKLTGQRDGDNAGFKYIQVCSYAADYIDAYTVVLREGSADNRSIIFYTDVRSPKVGDIKQNNKLTVISYNDEQKIQLILKGEAEIHFQNDTAAFYWQKDGYRSRRSYLAQPAPTTSVEEATDGLLHLSNRKFDDADAAGYENFAVVKINVNYLEYLQLSRDGNRRAKFSWQGAGWDGTWLIP
ncbi:pyridoxamine 5'-phosphate oxidase family protein [Mucilaginibacter sp. PAMB04274]|uniref:pyridoxamine 5'-phosphate oxidase family protein n=1 Tax=Mucilaginibacter sp. PAMB04274 TaxID=3138568 RepID=UPI0031F67AA5